jgi:hypothetical protein
MHSIPCSNGIRKAAFSPALSRESTSEPIPDGIILLQWAPVLFSIENVIVKPISGYCPAEICGCNEPWSKIVGMFRG